MTLRARIFALFLALAAAPLLLLAVLSARAADSAVEALIEEQVEHLAMRSAAAVESRQALHRSDMLLLAENTETVRLFTSRTGNSALTAAEKDSALAYLHELWTNIQEQYHAIELVDAEGTTFHVLGELAAARAPDARRAEQPVVEPDTDRVLGVVRAHLRSRAFLPVTELANRFGPAGATYVVDRSNGLVIYDPHIAAPRAARTGERRPPTVPPAAELGATAAALRMETPEGTRIGYHVPLSRPEWSVVVTSALDDFAGPFQRLGRWGLTIVLLTVVLTTAAFALLLRRATSSLRALTAAADALGRGDFAPELPPAGRDEVGRLTTAFGLMAAKIRKMLTRVESSRQMAVLGDFAARLSHEVRNPLTAIKLNLQALDQDARANRLTSEAASRPLAISLREIDRLDAVLRGVLDLARLAPAEPAPLRLHALLHDLKDLLRAQAERREVTIRITEGAVHDRILADPGELKGALLNLLLNAVGATAEGTSVHVETANEDDGASGTVVVRVHDEGPGVPPHLRDEIFRPFFTTRPDGTGLGLPLAARVAHDLGGSLHLGDPERGAEFVLTLPLHSDPVRERLPIIAAAAGLPEWRGMTMLPH